MPRQTTDDPVLATNKKVFHDYNVLECFEAGIKLTGTEVKSCRDRAITMQDGYVTIANGEAFLCNVHIAIYLQGNIYNHQPKSRRRLLLHKNEILKLGQWLGQKGGTVVPLKFYLKGGLVKVEVAYCQGKNKGDKREAMRKRQDEMDARRAMNNARK